MSLENALQIETLDAHMLADSVEFTFVEACCDRAELLSVSSSEPWQPPSRLL